MKRSIRIIAMLLLVMTLISALPLSVFAQILADEEPHIHAASETEDGDGTSANDDHDHDPGATEPSIQAARPISGATEGDAAVEQVSTGGASETTGAASVGTVEPGEDTPKPNSIIKGTQIPGDINGDGSVDNMDAILLFRYMTEWDVSVDGDALDIDGNGYVDNYDAIVLFRYISDWKELTIGYGHGWNIGCKHTLSYVEAKAASCTEDGNNEHWLCTACHLSFADAEAERVIHTSDVIITSYSQHTFTAWEDLSAATCTSKGLRTHTCTSCGYVENEETAMLGHTVDAYTVDRDATCTTDGVRTGVCTTCGSRVESIIPAYGHEAGSPMELVGQQCGDRVVGTISCTRCETVLSTFGHSYQTKIENATCTTAGRIIRSCSQCGDTTVEIMEPRGHKEGFVSAVTEATCSAGGEMAVFCLYCDHIFEETRYSTAPLVHTYTISRHTDGYHFTCESCGDSYTAAPDTVTVYEITFVTEQGGELSPLYVPAGADVSLPLLSAPGYTFGGWFKDSSLLSAVTEEDLTGDITLYAKWDRQSGNDTSDNILSAVPTAFAFTVLASDMSDPMASLTVLDTDGYVVSVVADDLGNGRYAIRPAEAYTKGGHYHVILKNGTSFADFAGSELWFTVERENTSEVRVHDGVFQINYADVIAVTEGTDGHPYMMTYDSIVMQDGDYFVVYEHDVNNIVLVGRVGENGTGTFEKYRLYRIDELAEEEMDTVFASIDISYQGDATIGEFTPAEDMLEAATEAFTVSPLYRQINTAATRFAGLSSDGKYYYDHEIPKIEVDFTYDSEKVCITFKVDIVFQRLNTQTMEHKDTYTISLVIKSETTFDVDAYFKHIRKYEVILRPSNKTTVGIYAKTGEKIENDARLDLFKALFEDAMESGKTDAIENRPATKEEEKSFGTVTLFSVYGVSLQLELYNVFSFEAMGEIGLEVTVETNPMLGVGNYGKGVKLLHGFTYYMTANAYAKAKLTVTDKLGIRAKIDVLGLANFAADLEIGPYAEAGGMINFLMEWGTNMPISIGAAAAGYIEAGINVYVGLAFRTIGGWFEKEWELYNKKFVLFSVGVKEMPVKFVRDDGDLEVKADITQKIPLGSMISNEAVFQNLQTMETSNREVKVTYEILDNPGYAAVSTNGNVWLTTDAYGMEYVELKIKVYNKNLFKIVRLKIHVSHDYPDEFTCHDRVCRFCDYLCVATTEHKHTDWVDVPTSLCTPQPYLMRTCTDCRENEFDGIDPSGAQHHDYIIVEEKLPTCLEPGYMIYRCAREGCGSEQTVTTSNLHNYHDFIWVNTGDSHYSHCIRVGCGYNTYPEAHTPGTAATCTAAQFCRDCGVELVPALGHAYTRVAAQATDCTRDGHTAYDECERCHTRVGYEVIEAWGHDYTVMFTWNGFESVDVTATCANGHVLYTTASMSYVTDKWPSCLSSGQRTHTAQILIDDQKYVETRVETIKPYGHELASVAAQASTCRAKGWEAHEICTRCSYSTKIEKPLVPHRGGTATCSAHAVCDMCGERYGNTLDHVYSTTYRSDASGHWYFCTVCGAAKEVLDHIRDRVEATEQEPVKCTVCAYVIQPATGHIKHTFTVPQKDEIHHWNKCTQCDETDERIEHGGGMATCLERATCTTCGVVYGTYGYHQNVIRSSEQKHWEECTVCYKTFSYGDHEGGEAACGEQAVCTFCERAYGESGPHDFSPLWRRDVTGHWHGCACGEKQAFAEHIPDRDAPTEKQAVRCTVCSYEIEPATGHVTCDFSILESDAIHHWLRCSGCEKTMSDAVHFGGTLSCTERKVCVYCDTPYGEEPAHDPVTVYDETDHWSECTRCGERIGETVSHTFQISSGVDTHWQACSCGYTMGEAVHSGGTATCDAKAVCTVCLASYGEQPDHVYEIQPGLWAHWEECVNCGKTCNTAAHSAANEATCLEKSVCAECGVTFGTLGRHQMVLTATTEQTHTSTCKVCSYQTTGNHYGGTATCTDRKVCTACDVAYGRTLPHAYATAWSMDADHHWHECACGAQSEMADHIPNRAAPTETEAVVCTVCSYVIAKATGHITCDFSVLVPGTDDHWYKCSGCSETTGIEKHHGGEATCTERAVCEVCGRSYGKAKEHITIRYWDEGMHWEICQVCDEELNSSEHYGGTATCTELAFCSVCYVEYGELEAHAMTVWKSDVTGHWPACANCRYEDPEKKVAHTPEADDHDCTTALHCSACQRILVKAQTHVYSSAWEHDATGHWHICLREGCAATTQKSDHTAAADDGDCTTDVLCTACRGVAIPAETHDFGETAAYDYDDQGHWRICANKGCTATDRATDTVSHAFGEWVNAYFDKGSHVRMCVCGKSTDFGKHTPEDDDGDCSTAVLCSVCRLEVIEAQWHDFSDTYQSDGTNHWLICTNAGCTVTNTPVAHSFGPWRINALDTSRHIRTCTVCDRKDTAAHNFADGAYCWDSDNHWKQCADCTAEDYAHRESHDGTVATCTELSFCRICQSEYGTVDPNNHDYATELSFDILNHFNACTRCDHQIHVAEHELSYRVEVDEDSDHGEYEHIFIEFCEICSYEREISHETLHEHRALLTIPRVPPTCTEPGRTVELRCGEPGCDHVYLVAEEIPAVGHSIMDGGDVAELAPTCTSPGNIAHKTCRWCLCALDANGNKIDAIIPKLGHLLMRADGTTVRIDETLTYFLADYPEFVANCVGTPPTDTTAGQSSFVCSDCRGQIHVKVIGHAMELAWNDTHHWTVCAVAGCTERTADEAHRFNGNVCTVCGHEQQLGSTGLSFTSNGDGTCYVSGIGTCTDTEIIIPTVSPAGDTVTGIGGFAFRNCTQFTGITIPYGVTSIGSSAFELCTSLTSITIPDSVMNIGNSAFYGCCKVTSITLPNGVTSIGDSLFGSCSKLMSIIIPDSVTSIGKSAFYYCRSLTNIAIPSSVTSIGNQAFFDCRSLTNIVIPHGVTSINYQTFVNCSSLTSITIPDSVTSIGDQAFFDCRSLTNIVIPHGVTSINYQTFANCSSLTSITIPDSVTSIGNRAFYDCSVLTTITFRGIVSMWQAITKTSGWDNNTSAYIIYCTDGEIAKDGTITYYPQTSTGLSFTSNGDGTCYVSGIGSCTDTEIIIPEVSPAGERVTSIGYRAFQKCKNLKSITIPNGVTSIGNQAFGECSGLTTVTLPDSVTSIGTSAFSGCSMITSIALPDSVTSIGNFAFSSCSSLTSMTIPEGVTSIRNSVFSSCRSLANITIPDSVTSIGDSVFIYCTSLTSITIPNGVTSIGKSAFNYCNKLQSITIPSSVTSIGDSAFRYCYALWSITLGDSVTSISNYMFYDCNKLESITIPDSVTSIGTAAFRSCTKLTSITIPSGVTSIGDSAFKGCNNLTSLTMHDGVTNIGSSAFDNCFNLQNITIPKSVTSIGDSAFEGCSNRTSITVAAGNSVYHVSGNCLIETASKTMLVGHNDSIIPTDGSVTNISNNAFSGCQKLTEINIPDSVASIGSYAFYFCLNLKSINIPNGVPSIGEYTFGGCRSLTSVKISNSVTSIGNSAFYNCSTLTTITFQGTVSEWQAITKTSGWDNNTPAYTVYCTDGEIAKDGTITYYPQTSTGLSFTSNGDGTCYVSGIGSCTDTEIIIPEVSPAGDTVTGIGGSAFYHSSLTSITIPTTVTHIGTKAFGDTYLTSITYLGTTAQWEAITKETDWDLYLGYYTVYCTNGTLTHYPDEGADVGGDIGPGIGGGEIDPPELDSFL